MKQHLLLCVAALAGTAVSAQEVGTVLSATPVVQQMPVSRLVCQDQTVATASAPSGAGAVIGAIAGGVLGSAFGGGSGQMAATAFGALGGAVVGNQMEGQSAPRYQTVQNCSTQTFYESRTVSYHVVYEYAGRQYTAQMPYDPGPTMPLQVSPLGNAPPPPVQAPARIISSTTYVQPYGETVTVLPPATVYREEPVYAGPSSYVAPLAIGLGLGVIAGRAWGPRHFHGPPRGYYRHRR
jgi:uncharacterized protein YcfJ